MLIRQHKPLIEIKEVVVNVMEHTIYLTAVVVSSGQTLRTAPVVSKDGCWESDNFRYKEV